VLSLQPVQKLSRTGEDEKKRDVLVTFAYPSNKVVVEFEIGKLIFQKWASFDTSHMTPVALSFDSQNVYLRDELPGGYSRGIRLTNLFSCENRDDM